MRTPNSKARIGISRALPLPTFSIYHFPFSMAVPAAPLFLHYGFADNFLDCCHAVVDRHQAALSQGSHAAFFGFEAEDLGAGVLDDQIADFIVQRHDLVQALAA